MSPRPYRLGLRQAAITETRARIVSAARELLMTSSGAAGFTVDAVARQANVARMTVYYQFGSKAGLLEALFDDLAARGGMQRLASAFQRPDPLEALDEFIGVFSHFWDLDRVLIRRLGAFAALDPELGAALRERSLGARRGLEVLVGRIANQRAQFSKAESDEVVEMLFALTTFATFDTLAGTDREADEVARMVRRMARGILQGGSL